MNRLKERYGICYLDGPLMDKTAFRLVHFGGPRLWGLLHWTLYYLGSVFEFDPGPADAFVALAQPELEIFVPLGDLDRGGRGIRPPAAHLVARAACKAALVLAGPLLLGANSLGLRVGGWTPMGCFRLLAWRGTFGRFHTARPPVFVTVQVS